MVTPTDGVLLRADRNALIARGPMSLYGRPMRVDPIRIVRAAAAALVMAALATCGGGPPASPQPGGTRTDTFSGTGTVNTGGGCSPGSHAFNTAGAGTITVQVVQSNLPNVGIQICHPGALNHATDCTVPPWTTIAANGTLTATIRGARAQTISVTAAGCDTTTVTAATLNYTVNVTYPF